MPSEEEIKYMFKTNKDGAGFAVQGWFEYERWNPKTKKKEISRRFEVHYQKGFMNVDDLIEALGPADKLKDKRVVMHCRITTNGLSNAQTTHPFLLSCNYGDLRKTKGEGAVLFHNGVFTGLGGIIDPQASDTQDFVVGVAAKMLNNPTHISKIATKIAQTVAGVCRVLILYPNPKHPDFRIGNWVDHNGCKYSNSNFKGGQDSKYYSGYYPTKYTGYSEDDIDAYYRRKRTATQDVDKWGMNSAEFAWPSMHNHWIKIASPERLAIIKRSAIRVEQKEKKATLYYFAGAPNTPWVIDEQALEMYDKEGYKLKLQKQCEEDEEAQWEENVMQFDDLEELEDYKEMYKAGDQNVAYIEGDYWYFDKKNLVAYTDRGLKMLFKPGEVGHVRRAIINKGYDSYSEEQEEIRNYMMFAEEEEI